MLDRLHGSLLNKCLDLPVEAQYELAKCLAANCGYQLVPEDNERSVIIKTILSRMQNNGPAVKDDGDRDILMQGLEGLLK